MGKERQQRASDFIQELNEISSSPPENLELTSDYVERAVSKNIPITFFSWKMYKSKFIGGKVVLDYTFDTNEASQYIGPEKQFLNLLEKHEIPFQYFKIVPNDLSHMYWGVDNPIQEAEFSHSVQEYFQLVHSDTVSILFTEFLGQCRLQDFYHDVYNQIYDSFDGTNSSPFVDPAKFQLEVELRKKYHALQDEDTEVANELARRAFALFAAETNSLLHPSAKIIFNQVVLIAGARSVDTYKYEYFRYPPERPTLPKLFVI